MSTPLPAAKPPSRDVWIAGPRIVYSLVSLVGSLLLAAGCLRALGLVSGPAAGPGLFSATVATSTVSPVIVPFPESLDLGVVAQGGRTENATIFLSQR